ncbi:MAG: hypothetical protein K0R31_335 [Clostridiales bacterium]|nr:hypothetical protein [Clostridiales bacterium]
MNNNNKTNSILKLLAVILLGIFGLWLISTLLIGPGFGVRIGMTGYQGGGHMTMGYSYGVGYGGTISLILLFLIKVLFVLFVVGLVVGIAIAIKRYIFTADDIAKIKGTFVGNKTVVIKEACNI